MTLLRALFWLSIFSVPVWQGHASEGNWPTSLEAAFKASAISGKPVLAFRSSEKEAQKFLGSPLIREAIKSEFHPAIITTKARDSLAQFFNEERNMIASVSLREIGEESLAVVMIEALQNTNREVPLYLRALSGEASADSVGTVAFAMFCFWTGEQKLGGLNGVLTTEAGWVEHREVTKVTFDRAVLPFATLLAHATSYDCARKVFTTNNEDSAQADQSRLSTSDLTKSYRKAKSSDQKRQLSGTVFQKFDLTPVQATKINAVARTEPKEALKWLSPKQREQLK